MSDINQVEKQRVKTLKVNCHLIAHKTKAIVVKDPNEALIKAMQFHLAIFQGLAFNKDCRITAIEIAVTEAENWIAFKERMLNLVSKDFCDNLAILERSVLDSPVLFMPFELTKVTAVDNQIELQSDINDMCLCFKRMQREIDAIRGNLASVWPQKAFHPALPMTSS